MYKPHHIVKPFVWKMNFGSTGENFCCIHVLENFERFWNFLKNLTYECATGTNDKYMIWMKVPPQVIDQNGVLLPLLSQVLAPTPTFCPLALHPYFQGGGVFYVPFLKNIDPICKMLNPWLKKKQTSSLRSTGMIEHPLNSTKWLSNFGRKGWIFWRDATKIGKK